MGDVTVCPRARVLKVADSRSLFAAIDKDGSGTLDFSEFRQALLDLNVQASPATRDGRWQYRSCQFECIAMTYINTKNTLRRSRTLWRASFSTSWTRITVARSTTRS